MSRPSSLSFRRTLSLSIALPILVMTALAACLVWGGARLLAVRDAVEHSDRVVAQARHVEVLVADMHRGFRGYLITGERDFLEPHARAAAGLDRAFRDLEDLLADDARGLERIGVLRREAESWDRYRAEVMALRDSGGDYVRAVGTRRGKDLVDAMRAEIEGLIRDEAPIRSRRSEAAQESSRRLIGAGIAIALLLGVGLAAFGRRQLLGLSRTYEEALRAVREQAAALRESESRFRTMADTAPVLIWMAGPDGGCSFLNARWLEFTGRPLERELGQGWAESVHPEDRGRVVEAWTQAFGLSRPFAAEYRLRRADGEFRWMLATGVPRVTSERALDGYVGSAVDITERKLAEDLMREYQDELERRVRVRTAQLEASNRELEAFSYSVSHDLRTPLRSITSFSQALLEDYAERLDDEGREHLRRVCAAGARMAQLIDDLLNLSRVTRSAIRFEPVDLSALARAVTAELGRNEPARHVEFMIQDDLRATCDPRLVRIALDNLLGNAWKFTAREERSLIEVGALPSNNGGPAVYYVRDNGAGFEMEYAGKLFSAFQRLHGVLEFAGTGIGLATVHRIVTRHGGRVWAEGEVNRGATVYFTLDSDTADASPRLEEALRVEAV